jgi:hypothetical protein
MKRKTVCNPGCYSFPKRWRKAMDGKLWATIYQTVMTIDHPKPSKRMKFSDREIVLVVLRATYDEKSINWACRPEHWHGMAMPTRLPSQSTVSRRAQSVGVGDLLEAVESFLGAQASDSERVVAVDGRPLLISPFSKDPDAHWGYGIKGFGFGYKLHAIWGTGPVPLAWCLRSLNVDESVTAANYLAPLLPTTSKKRYLLGDAAYDTNRLHAAVAARGFQLLAPPKHNGDGLGHRSHHPARIRALELLQTPYGKALYRQRGVIERQFGNATMRGEGLGSLPAHVRRLPRVKLFVQGKLILNGFRILANRNQPLSTAA